MATTSKQSNKKSATKYDLVKLEKKLEKKLASKGDLKELKKEFKKDLDKFAVRAFNTFASKENMKKLRQEMATKDDLTEFKNELLTAMDFIAVKHQENDAERTANIGAHDRIEEDIAKTNKRVTIVEKKLEAVHVSA